MLYLAIARTLYSVMINIFHTRLIVIVGIDKYDENIRYDNRSDTFHTFLIEIIGVDWSDEHIRYDNRSDTYLPIIS